MEVETSIIIRTKNEERWLGVVLKKISQQTYKKFEVIIVDSGSTDQTLEIAGRFGVKIFRIPPENFSYPYALNYGIERSSAGKYIVIISGHSVPVSETWLEDGLNNFSRYEKIMGVYGFLRALPGTGFWDKFFLNWRYFFRRLVILGKYRNFLVYSGKMGVMGFTNAVILRELWNKRIFNEDYGAGGEDGEWANYWFIRGYRAVKDEKFTVFHSHNLGLLEWYRQYRYWKALVRPRPFNPKELDFRNKFN